MDKNITAYNQFVNKLKIDLKNFPSTPKKLWKEKAIKNVNGFAADELRRLVGIETRRQYGAFFTDSLLAKKVLEFLKPIINKNSIIYDPACGAGNLLIAIMNYASESNINLAWEKHLFGTDIHNEFIDAAKLRLITNEILLNHNNISSEYASAINKKYSLLTADGLLKNKFYEKATHIIVNPPFNQIVFDEKVNWAAGKISAAALFIDKIIKNSNPGVSITAILPDVLRSGTRYEKWRNMVENECKIEEEILLGQFDKYADVDVYALQLTKRKKIRVKKNTKEFGNANSSATIKDLFDICVGPVVDNRDIHKGESLGYIISKGLENWEQKKEFNLMRKHKGKSFKSPFIVVKRTSRMSDLSRAKATIINISSPVYVDNHLIILKPKSKSITVCRKILNLLKAKKTNQWINEKIRCRHLTVKIIKDIPLSYRKK